MIAMLAQLWLQSKTKNSESLRKSKVIIVCLNEFLAWQSYNKCGFENIDFKVGSNQIVYMAASQFDQLDKLNDEESGETLVIIDEIDQYVGYDSL